MVYRLLYRLLGRVSMELRRLERKLEEDTEEPAAVETLSGILHSRFYDLMRAQGLHKMYADGGRETMEEHEALDRAADQELDLISSWMQALEKPVVDKP